MDVVDYNKKDNLSELYSAVEIAYNDAEESAEYNAYYRKAKKSIEDTFGEFKNIKYGTYKGKDGTEYDKYIWIFNINNVIDSWNNLIDELNSNYTYKGETDYSYKQYGSILQIIREFDLIEHNDINYEYVHSGPIDKIYLNERVVDRLSF